MATKKNVLGGKKSTGVTGLKGVTPRGNRFQAILSMKFEGKTYNKYIGSFGTAKEGYKARCEYIDSLK